MSTQLISILTESDGLTAMYSSLGQGRVGGLRRLIDSVPSSCRMQFNGASESFLAVLDWLATERRIRWPTHEQMGIPLATIAHQLIEIEAVTLVTCMNHREYSAIFRRSQDILSDNTLLAQILISYGCTSERAEKESINLAAYFRAITETFRINPEALLVILVVGSRNPTEG